MICRNCAKEITIDCTTQTGVYAETETFCNQKCAKEYLKLVEISMAYEVKLGETYNNNNIINAANRTIARIKAIRKPAKNKTIMEMAI